MEGAGFPVPQFSGDQVLLTQKVASITHSPRCSEKQESQEEGEGSPWVGPSSVITYNLFALCPALGVVGGGRSGTKWSRQEDPLVWGSSSQPLQLWTLLTLPILSLRPPPGSNLPLPSYLPCFAAERFTLPDGSLMPGTSWAPSSFLQPPSCIWKFASDWHLLQGALPDCSRISVLWIPAGFLSVEADHWALVYAVHCFPFLQAFPASVMRI